MESDLISFQDGADNFVSTYKTIPTQKLSYKPAGDDYATGGLLVHVIDVMKKYSEVLDAILAPSRNTPIHSRHRTLEQDEHLIHEGIDETQKAALLTELQTMQQYLMKRLRSLSEKEYSEKVPVVYDGAEDAYPTSPADVRNWLMDHYTEHTAHIQKLLG